MERSDRPILIRVWVSSIYSKAVKYMEFFIFIQHKRRIDILDSSICAYKQLRMRIKLSLIYMIPVISIKIFITFAFLRIKKCFFRTHLHLPKSSWFISNYLFCEVIWKKRKKNQKINEHFAIIKIQKIKSYFYFVIIPRILGKCVVYNKNWLCISNVWLV